MQIENILKNLGFKEKDIVVYLTLLQMGPSPVRALAAKANVNRGTTYDILKSLIEQGLVSYFDKQSHQYFAAEPPNKLLAALKDKQAKLDEVKKNLEQGLPELNSLFENRGGKPVTKLYEGIKGIRTILEDILERVETRKPKEYYVYSSANLRMNVYLAMPDFSNRRIKKGIKVKTIALGSGGQLVGLDERKWLTTKETDNFKTTYEIIYAGKVAHISLDAQSNPVGVIIENLEIFETQKAIFESLWGKL